MGVSKIRQQHCTNILHKCGRIRLIFNERGKICIAVLKFFYKFFSEKSCTLTLFECKHVFIHVDSVLKLKNICLYLFFIVNFVAVTEVVFYVIILL